MINCSLLATSETITGVLFAFALVYFFSSGFLRTGVNQSLLYARS